MRMQALIASITACALLGAGCLYPADAEPLVPSNTVTTGATIPTFIDADIFAIPELMGSAQEPLPAEEEFPCKKFRAGIVNHHALASDLLAAFFRTLARCRPDIETIVVLSPDHFGQATTFALTHTVPYRVAGQDVLVDEEAVRRAETSIPSIRREVEPFRREHGVGALLPFLKQGFPEARIMPLMVRGQIDQEGRDEIAAWLSAELARPGVFVVVSSDMSHYLAATTAWEKQAEVRQALDRSDAAFFERADDAYTDNGESIAIAMQALGKTKWTQLAESISSAYAGSPGFTTTYLIGFWD